MTQTRTITVRGVPEEVLEALRSAARQARRSLNSEILACLERASGEPADRVGEPAYRADSLVDAEVLDRVCRQHHITSLAVFGSQAQGTAMLSSDVDVVVEFAVGRTPGLGFITVAEDLRAAFGGRRVDLVTRKGLSPRLRERVEANEVRLYGA